VHPTQIYESLCGLALVALLLLARRHQKFRGQIFFTFAFGYGYLRFLLEMLRDDAERGEFGPAFAEHLFLPGALLLMSLGLCFGIALGIQDRVARTAVRILGFVPPVVAYLMLKPPSFGSSVTILLSTSQWIGLVSALLVSYFYAQFWDVARKQPALAMSVASLGPGAEEYAKGAQARAEDGAEGHAKDEDDEHDEEEDRRGGPGALPSESK
jgi:phosphatidylglycerol:prolipoprotein diacylglycerol transferase